MWLLKIIGTVVGFELAGLCDNAVSPPQLDQVQGFRRLREHWRAKQHQAGYES